MASIPTRFGKYTLLERLAVGGMAEIFLAKEETELSALAVCIKRIRPALTSQPAFVHMFLNEARLAAQLNHPNVAQIFELGKIGDSYYIAMEYISGRDMRRLVPKAEEMGIPFPIVYALKVASSACEGLHYAHQKVDLGGNPLNIVHRDVTPENILVSFDGAVKLLDFGIAKAANQVERTQAGEIRGKLSYMSPEQVAGKPLDGRSDVFSLGVALYEWLTGFKLFRADSEIGVLKSISDGQIYAPTYFRPELPDEVERMVMRALEKDRERRYQSARELQQDIDRFLSTYEFTPTTQHLSNFVRQVFFDELEAERARLEPFRRKGEGALERREPPRIDRPAPASVAEAPVPDTARVDRALRVVLPPGEQEALAKFAAKHSLSPEELAREVLLSWLRYR